MVYGATTSRSGARVQSLCDLKIARDHQYDPQAGGFPVQNSLLASYARATGCLRSPPSRPPLSFSPSLLPPPTLPSAPRPLSPPLPLALPLSGQTFLAHIRPSSLAPPPPCSLARILGSSSRPRWRPRSKCLTSCCSPLASAATTTSHTPHSTSSPPSPPSPSSPGQPRFANSQPISHIPGAIAQSNATDRSPSTGCTGNEGRFL
eukprot:3597427-Rhodomonas_salina.1